MEKVDGFISCDDCGRICRGSIYSADRVWPIGVNKCPGCSGTNWSVLFSQQLPEADADDDD